MSHFTPTRNSYANSVFEKHSFCHISLILSVVDIKQGMSKEVHWHVVGRLNTHSYEYAGRSNAVSGTELLLVFTKMKIKNDTASQAIGSYKCFTWVCACMAWRTLFRFHRSIFTSLKDFFRVTFLSVQVFSSILHKHIDYCAEICGFTARFG